MWICVVSSTDEVAKRNENTASSRYFSFLLSLRGNPSRIAGSSTWIIVIPAFSKSSISFLSAIAIWLKISALEISVLSNDQFRIVTGPVNIPLTGRLVKL